jgi:hypothetical protein
VTEAEKRHQRNQDLLNRMRENDPLVAISATDSHYPKRPPIKKLPREMERIFGKDSPGRR